MENLSREATTCVVSLLAEADFADLFLVKEGPGRRGGRGVHSGGRGAGVHLPGRRGPPAARHRLGRTAGHAGRVEWRIVVPARGRWSAEVVAEPMASGRWIAAALPPRRAGRESAPAARRLRDWRRRQHPHRGAGIRRWLRLRRTQDDLGALRIADPAHPGGPPSPPGAPWFMTLFGRDSPADRLDGAAAGPAPRGRHAADARAAPGDRGGAGHRGGARPDPARDAVRGRQRRGRWAAAPTTTARSTPPRCS